jgi:Fe-S cluster biogenesis protein NfuA
MNNNEFQARTEQIYRLVQRVTAFKDDDARVTSLELLQSMMDLHGAAMARMVELLADSGEAGRKSLAKLSDDPLICGLLVVYGIHPVELKERIVHAIEKVRPQLRKQSGSVEIIEVGDDTARVKIQNSGHSCGSSVETLKAMVEQAIFEAAPEIVSIVVEGSGPERSGFVSLERIQPANKEEMKYEKSTA